VARLAGVIDVVRGIVVLGVHPDERVDPAGKGVAQHVRDDPAEVALEGGGDEAVHQAGAQLRIDRKCGEARTARNTSRSCPKASSPSARALVAGSSRPASWASEIGR